MAEEFANKIKRLELENFTCFGKVAMDFSPGINVLIGENGTGKTHLLKVLYYFTRSAAYRNLWDLFKVDKVSNLSRDIEVDAKGKVYWNSFERKFTIESRVSPNKLLGESKSEGSHAKINDSIFLPPQEMLSWYTGFSSLYNRREIAFDKTYYDLSEALGLPLLRNSELEMTQQLITKLENELNIRITKKDDKFFISWNSDGELEASIVATGINKLAQLIYLIMNGSLTKDTILFWDEPEANLNPKYILVVSKFLQTLAKAGCQIFVATHDYLLPYDLSLSKEYQEVEGDVPDMKFFSLYKGENGTEVEEGATMSDLNHDPIHEGLSKHNQREDILFRKSLNPQA